MTRKVFIDTNILVYSMDKYNPHRRDRARKIIKELIKENSGVISTQVMQEFFVAATKKLNADPLKVKAVLHSFENLEIVSITPAIIKEAIDCGILNQISFWDSLIVVAAEYSRCCELWTEDMNAGQLIRGVRIINPFNPKQDS